MLLRELLRSYGWTVADSMPNVETAVSALKQGFAYLVIVDDTQAAPAAKAVRYLLSDPVGITTPTLAFTLETHKDEIASLSRVGRPKLVDKPLTPAKFLPGFVSLVKLWENEPFLSLRRATYAFMAANDAKCLRTLLKLAEDKDAQAIASGTLSLHLRRLGKIKEAETVLLGSLKRAPRELGTMLLLADLYLHAAKPRLAYRLLTGARNVYPNSMAVLIDSAQAAMLTGQAAEAIEHLFALVRRGYMEAEAGSHLSRLLFAEGREVDTEKILNNNKTSLKKLQDGWIAAESLPLNASA
jgi:hypothetical protein